MRTVSNMVTEVIGYISSVLFLEGHALVSEVIKKAHDSMCFPVFSREFGKYTFRKAATSR